jgi:FkbM family methyltransferase
MARVVRQLRATRLIGRAVCALPALSRCARLFRNWVQLTRLYAGRADFVPPVEAIGRRNFRLRLYEPADVQTAWVVFCADSYRVRSLPPTPVVLDLGANIGAFTVLAARVLGAQRVVALEPVGATYERLCENVTLNGLQDRVTALRLGLAGRGGTRTIQLGTASAHASLYYRGDTRFESGRQEEIAVTTLDDLLARLDAPEIDVCKLDCEGAEYEALKAASDEALRRIKRICMEYHPQRDWPDPEPLFARLRETGFRRTWHNARDRLAVFERRGP